MPYVHSALANTIKGGGKLFKLQPTSIPRLAREKGGLMFKTFATLIAQLLVTYFVIQKLSESAKFQTWRANNNVLFIVLSIVATIGILVLLALVPMPIYLKLVLVLLFAVVFGMMLSSTVRYISPDIIKAAILGTIGVFVSMFIVGVFFVMVGVNLWWLGILLMIALIGLIITSIVFLFIDESNRARRIKAAVAIAVFALFIMFDTNQILQRDYMGDFVTAAMDYYLDSINLFINFLQYFLSED
jgi:FtsH-binding integral membrane protein